jgi:signal transduction histidine kinase
MRARRSLVTRVAWGAIASACVASLVAAAATSAVSAVLVRRAEDRRLSDAARVLAHELEAVPASGVEAVVLEEGEETQHTGIAFAVFEETRLRAGDARVPAVLADACSTTGSVRACAVRAGDRFTVVSAATHTDTTPILALSALTASLVAAALAWIAGRRVARWGIAPLSRLERRVAAIEPGVPADLGPPETVAEVRALQSAMEVLLARADRALAQSSRFAADAAHELRTPLSALRAELELLAEEPSLSRSASADVAGARKSVERLEVLVERLLVLALPTESPQERAPVDLRELVEESLALLPPGDRARVALGPGSPAVVDGDSVLLVALLSNALSNALKFGSNVVVDVVPGAHDFAVRVDDDGPGVPVDERTRLFDPFVRGATARAKRVPGHGLGLAVIAHVASLHGGSAAFVDAPRAGARLEVRLPASVRSTA